MQNDNPIILASPQLDRKWKPTPMQQKFLDALPPRDTQRGLSKRAEMRKVCFGEEWVILCHTESVLR